MSLEEYHNLFKAGQENEKSVYDLNEREFSAAADDDFLPAQIYDIVGNI